MPTKRRRKIHERVTLGPLELDHLLEGDCAMGMGCRLCRPDDSPNSPCPRPMNMELAQRLWREHRRELLAQWDAPKTHGYYARKLGAFYGWGDLAPRLPTAAEILFDGVALPPTFDAAWPEPARRCWLLMAVSLARLRAYYAATDAEYEAAAADFRALCDVDIGTDT